MEAARSTQGQPGRGSRLACEPDTVGCAFRNVTARWSPGSATGTDVPPIVKAVRVLVLVVVLITVPLA